MESPGNCFFPLEDKSVAHSGADGFRSQYTLAGLGSASGSSNVRDVLFKYVPILEWLPAYPWKENSAKDLAGAATLGCILVAQSLAHADLCKVALVCGPYSCILPPIVYSLFGTCVHSSVGTGGLISLLTGIQLEKYGNLEERTHAGPIFTLLVGVIITLMGVLRLAFMTRFLSRPALSGFITASAILIIASQFKPMLGLPKTISGGIFHILFMSPWELRNCSWPTCLVSLVSYAFLVNSKKLRRVHWSLKFCGDFKELVLLAISAVFCFFQAEALGIAIVGKVPSGLPRTTWPLTTTEDWHLAKEMLPGAFLVALVTFLSSFAGAKKFAMKAGYQVVAINELLALGLANVAGAFNGAVPTQIGLSRMGIAYSAGIRSQLGANVYVAIVVASVMYLFSGFLYYVPRCVLNAIIVNGASHLAEFDHMRWLLSLRACPGSKKMSDSRMFRTDFSVWWFSCLSTLYFGAFEGIVLTVIASLMLIIYQVVHPSITALGFSEDARGQHWKSLANMESKPRQGILVFRVEGPLFYANMERVQEWLEDAELRAAQSGKPPLKAIILMAASVPFVDSTALMALKTMMEAYNERGVAFLIAKATGQPKKFFQHVYSGMLTLECVDKDFSVQDCVDWLEEQETRREEEEKEYMALQKTDTEAADTGLSGDAHPPMLETPGANPPPGIVGISPTRGRFQVGSELARHSGMSIVSDTCEGDGYNMNYLLEGGTPCHNISAELEPEWAEPTWPPPVPRPLKKAAVWASHPEELSEAATMPKRRSLPSMAPQRSRKSSSRSSEALSKTGTRFSK